MEGRLKKSVLKDPERVYKVLGFRPTANVAEDWSNLQKERNSHKPAERTPSTSRGTAVEQRPPLAYYHICGFRPVQE